MCISGHEGLVCIATPGAREREKGAALAAMPDRLNDEGVSYGAGRMLASQHGEEDRRDQRQTRTLIRLRRFRERTERRSPSASRTCARLRASAGVSHCACST